MNRATIILIVVFVILALLVYFYIWLPGGEEREISYKSSNLSVKIDSASVIKISIQQINKSVTLENISGKWMVTSPINAAADPNNVKQVLSGLMKFHVGSLVSSNPEKQSLFQVDSNGTQLSVTERSGISTDLIIGKTGPSYSESYFRIPGSNDVYLGEGIYSWTINKDLKDWRDKTIFVTASDSIRQLTYHFGGKEFQFVRDSTGWQMNNKIIEADVIKPALTALSNFRADDFVDTLINFQTMPIDLEAHSTDNISLQLCPILPDSAKYFVKSSLTPQIFLISKWTAQELIKPVK